jgi:hypothetical protein
MEAAMGIEQERLDKARESVLDRMETGQRMVRIGTGAAATSRRRPT